MAWAGAYLPRGRELIATAVCGITGVDLIYLRGLCEISVEGMQRLVDFGGSNSDFVVDLLSLRRGGG